MKMKDNKLKSIVKQFSWVIILLLSTVIISCNSSTNQNTNKEDLAKEMQDVNEEVNEILDREKKELKTEVDSVLTDFDEQFYAYEKKVQKGTKKINTETEKQIAEFKAKSDTLSIRVDEILEQSDQNWGEFKEELQHDTENFAESVKDFFEDNK